MLPTLKFVIFNSQKMGVDFNGFSMNFQRWNYAILTGNYHLLCICSIFFQFVLKDDCFGKVKAWSWKIYVRSLNIERVKALQSSITFFATRCKSFFLETPVTRWTSVLSIFQIMVITTHETGKTNITINWGDRKLILKSKH